MNFRINRRRRRRHASGMSIQSRRRNQTYSFEILEDRRLLTATAGELPFGFTDLSKLDLAAIHPTAFTAYLPVGVSLAELSAQFSPVSQNSLVGS